MQYRLYGRTGKQISALGLGSTRFNPDDLNDEEGLDRCADIVIKASEQGVNYFDIAGNYSKSQCETIYRKAFENIKNPYFVTSKSSSFQDNTSDQVLRRIEQCLKNLNVNKIDFFYMWSIMDEDHFRDIMKKNGAYEGALKAKDSGLIDHIVFSNHAVPSTAIKIIEADLFEGVTLSYNLLNYKLIEPVIEAAARKNMGVTIMNPLAGGLIPQNKKYFSDLLNVNEEEVVASAMSFVYANPQVTCILSGVSNEYELMTNVAVLSGKTSAKEDIEFRTRVNLNMTTTSGLCTGCGYCKACCPKKISIPEWMQSYNMSLLSFSNSMYGRSSPDLLKRISVLKKLCLDFQMTPNDGENQCIACGACEKICTQHLPISRRMKEMAEWIRLSCSAKTLYRERLADKLLNKGYKQVVFYTAGGYTAFVLEQLKSFHGQFDFEVHIVDSNSSRWGEDLAGIKIKSPSDMKLIRPDIILITNYIYDEEIYTSLMRDTEIAMKVEKLHAKDDVPWVF